jgi:hypothetical protein
MPFDSISYVSMTPLALQQAVLERSYYDPKSGQLRAASVMDYAVLRADASRP